MRVAVAVLLLTRAHTSFAQQIDTWLESGIGGASWSTASAAAGRLRYVMLGARAEIGTPAQFLLLHGRASGGRGADGIGSASWGSGEAGAELMHTAGPVTLRMLATGWGIGYRQDALYRAAGIRLAPSATWQRSGLIVRARAEGVQARSWLDVLVRNRPPVPVPAPVPVGDSVWLQTSGHLSLGGGAIDVVAARGPLWLRLTPTAYVASHGGEAARQGALDGEVGLAARRASIAAGARWFSLAARGSAPDEETIGFHMRGRLALSSRLSLVAQADSRPWDPLHRVLSGAIAQIGLEWHWPLRRSRAAPLATLGEWDGSLRSVRFRLRASGATQVELLGSFNAWEPTPMRLKAGAWEAVLQLAPGSYQYGFRVDGVWTLPPAAESTVDDGWGRRNVTLIVEGRSL